MSNSSWAPLSPAISQRRTWLTVGLVAALSLLMILSSAVVVGVSIPASGAPAAGPVAGAVLPPALPVPAAGPTRMPLPASAPATGPLTLPSVHLPVVASTGAHPQSWGGPLPPGAEALSSVASSVTSRPTPGTGLVAPSSWGGGSNGSNSIKYCNGIWPSVSGQGGYYANCYGHDEPGANFYSPLPGSGGNVTWNVTLPMDRSTTHNQSNLYSAVWFGMTLADPYAWMGVCFLELQFYPDSSWTVPGPGNANYTVPGMWVGEAVAWQIQSATGVEDPCFISPLFANGTAGSDYFNMSQGNRIEIRMNGWAGSPYGENVTVTDLSNGNRSFLNLYNRTGQYANMYNQNNRYILGHKNYPLDPAYVTNSYENALAWTPGGEYPNSFAFEVGHSGNPSYPNNNSYHGCSGGPPPSTPSNPAVPCPSYDPGSWMNDTASPWQISVPTYSNATARMTPAQVGFTQDIGGLGYLNGSATQSYTACTNRSNTPWCSYPYYSFSCSEDAFNFGATNWAATSVDFGMDSEYSSAMQQNAAGLRFYPPQNFSVPSCGRSSATLTIGSGGGTGSAYFLSQAIASGASFTNLSSGEYALAAIPASGYLFSSWTTSGAVTVLDPSSPYTSVEIQGTGSVTPNFAASVTPTRITFVDHLSGSGKIEVVAGQLFRSGTGTVYANGSSAGLSPGLYSILALPEPGYNFTGWSLNNTRFATVAAPHLPYTILTVDASGSSSIAIQLSATFAATSQKGYLAIEVYQGQGEVRLTTLSSVFTSSYETFYTGVGNYTVIEQPAAGWSFAGWGSTSGIRMITFGSTTDFVLEGTQTYYGIVAAFFAPSVKIVDSATSGGQVALASQGYLPQPSGVSYLLAPGSYTLAAAPNSSYVFSSWSVSSRTALWVTAPTRAISVLVVNQSGTVTANFASMTGTGLELWLNDTAPAGGRILFNYRFYSNGQSNRSVGAGEFTAFPLPNAGYLFAGWSAHGGITINGAIATIASASGTGSLTALFVARPVVVGLVGYGTLKLDGTTVGTGTSTPLNLGNYSLSATLPTNTTFLGWVVSGDLSVAVPDALTTRVDVAGPGTLLALERGAPLVVGSATVNTTGPFSVGSNVTLRVAASGSGPFQVNWSGLPGCTGTTPGLTRVCAPSAAGTFNLTAYVTDAFTDGAYATPIPVEVVTPFEIISYTVSRSTVDVGANLSVQVVVSGGTLPYSYQFSGVPGCTAITGSVATCTPTSPGDYNLSVTARSGNGLSVTRSLPVQVNPTLQLISFTASPAALTLGGAVHLSARLSAGTTPYQFSYLNLPSGCRSSDAATLACVPGVAGIYNITLLAADSGGGSVNSSLVVRVNPAPAISSFLALPSSVQVGSVVVLTVNVNGGTLPFTYNYTGLPAGCASRNTSDLNCTPQAPGAYVVRVTVTDADGVTATSIVAVSVAAAPASGFSLSGSTLLILVVVIVVLAVALGAALLLRRRPPPSRPATPAAPPPKPPSGASPGVSPPEARR